jgi:caffeoyl-CoA O-methyltransferase
MRTIPIIQLGFFILTLLNYNYTQNEFTNTHLDTMVENFLKDNSGNWSDMNIPASDGQVLFDIIIEKGYTRALEIGTSTGHSAIWIAWALSKTGGKLTTLEIDERRYNRALENFQKAGVDSLIEAILADAHQLVPQLEGSYDFIFVDADKEWYSQYLKWLYPKLKTGGCFTAHNVLDTYYSGIPEFLEALKSLADLETSIVHSSGSGISVSYKVK